VRRIVVQMMLSLDGYFEGPDADLSWHLVDEDPDLPPVMHEFAGIWRAVPRIVSSRTLQQVGLDATLRSEVDPDEIRALRQQPGGDMTLSGVAPVETFRRLDLVDEYRLYVEPVVVGRGRRLFDTADSRTDQELVEDRRSGNGVVLLRYAVRRP
jgi:dihydrofolate reductase